MWESHLGASCVQIFPVRHNQWWTLICLVFIAGTEMGKLKMWWIQVKKFLVLCGMEGKEHEEIQKSSLSFCWACRELS